MSGKSTVLVDGEPMAVEGISLHDLIWDHRTIPGISTLEITLDENDLRQIGGVIMKLYREILAEDPEYFGEDMKGEPFPTSEDIFIEHPEELYRYMRRSNVWSRDTVIAILDHIGSRPDVRPTFLISSLREVRPGDRSVVLIFGSSLECHLHWKKRTRSGKNISRVDMWPPSITGAHFPTSVSDPPSICGMDCSAGGSRSPICPSSAN